MPSMLSKRNTTFGYGNKHDFTKGPKVPAPTKYIQKSFVDMNKLRSKGVTFGVSRSVLKVIIC